MKRFTLARIVHTDRGTFGVWIYKRIPISFSFELPWRDNKRDISCIPSGLYTAIWSWSPKRQKYVYELDNNQTFPRTDIQLHIANKLKDLLGCLSAAEKAEPYGTDGEVQCSGDAIREIERIARPDDHIEIEILPAFLNP